MAPPKGKDTPLELCTNSITLGNSVAVHMLDYLSIVKDPPHGFNRLAVEFLETSRVLIPTRTGLAGAARSASRLSADAASDLLERFRQIHTAFTVLNQVVNRYLDNERKTGFKFGKGFRMMFAESEIDKLRITLVQCREALAKSPHVQTWTLGENQIEPAAGIGYTALAAVLEKPDPTRGQPTIERAHSSPVVHTSPQLALPPLPPASPMLDNYNNSMSSRLDMPPPGWPESGHTQRERATGPSFSRESSSTSTQSPTFSNRSSSMPPTADTLSQVTTPMSSLDMEEMMSSHDLNETLKSGTRVKADPSQVPRLTPKRRTGTAGSQTALLQAVQQQNHRMIEQLLDCGVPPEGGDRNLLTVAIVNNDMTSVRLLLAFGAHVDAKDKDGYTPLFSATQASFFEATELILRYDADPNLSAGPYNESAFARAINSGQTPLADLFLRYGGKTDGIMKNGNTPFIQAINKTVSINLIELMLPGTDPNHKNARGETALFKAINAERLDIVSALIKHGSNPNLPGPKHMLWPAVHQPQILELLLANGADHSRAPGVLELATSINSLEAVSILLKNNIDVNAKKDGIFTPLCTAIRDNHEDLVDLLLASGASPNLKASEYPLFKCVTHHRPQFLERLFAAGAHLNSPPGIVETAVLHDEKEALRLLLAEDVDVNARSASGNTALTTAIRLDRHDMIDLLLAHKADPGKRGQEWPIAMAVKRPEILAKLLPHIEQSKIIKGALEMAVVAGQLESVKLLLAKGVPIEEKNGGVFSPLTTSIREDKKDIFYYLVENGADVNAPGEHLPIIKAIRRHRENDLSYIEHLINHGSDINLMYRGWNAVLQAVDNGDTKILKLLAEKGSPDLSAQDENGRTVLEIMEERGLREEEQILLGGRSPSPEIREANRQLRGFVQE